MEEILTFQGTHGTSASRATKIKKGGWIISSSSSGGMYGKGIYFWKECEYSLILAEGWYNQVKAKFSHDADQSCRIIKARLTAKASEVFDLELPDFKKQILSQATARRIDYNKRENIAVLSEWFVRESERRLNTYFKILLKRVMPPGSKYCTDYPRLLDPAPECLIARNVTCIHILDIVSCQNVRYA